LRTGLQNAGKDELASVVFADELDALRVDIEFFDLVWGRQLDGVGRRRFLVVFLGERGNETDRVDRQTQEDFSHYRHLVVRRISVGLSYSRSGRTDRNVCATISFLSKASDGGLVGFFFLEQQEGEGI